MKREEKRQMKLNRENERYGNMTKEELQERIERLQELARRIAKEEVGLSSSIYKEARELTKRLEQFNNN